MKDKFINRVLDGTSKKTTVNILGTKCQILIKSAEELERFGQIDGLAFISGKTILVLDPNDVHDDGYSDKFESLAKTLRHEILHMFHYMSGLQTSYELQDYEIWTEYYAQQFGKMNKVFKELGIDEVI